MTPDNTSHIVNRREFLQSAPRHFLSGIWAFLSQITAPTATRIAIIDVARCLAWGHSPCQVCYLRCPLRDEAMVLDDGRPLVITSACNGCGVCVETCRAVNDLTAIQLVRELKNSPSLPA